MNKVNYLYKHLRKERKEKVSKKDIGTVLDTRNNEDWTLIYKTKLYSKQSGAYCRLLELLHLMDLVDAEYLT